MAVAGTVAAPANGTDTKIVACGWQGADWAWAEATRRPGQRTQLAKSPDQSAVVGWLARILSSSWKGGQGGGKDDGQLQHIYVCMSMES